MLGKRAKLQAESPKEQKGLQELNEEIEVLGANIDYINDSISDCQATIMQIEETKVGSWWGEQEHPQEARVSLDTAKLGVPGSSEPCRTLGGAAPTQSLLMGRLIVEGSAARSLHVHGQAAGAPGPWDAGKLQPPSCPWGWRSLVPMGFSCAGNILGRTGFFPSRNPAGFVSSFDTGHAAETLCGSWLPSAGSSLGWRLCAVPGLSPGCHLGCQGRRGCC